MSDEIAALEAQIKRWTPRPTPRRPRRACVPPPCPTAPPAPRIAAAPLPPKAEPIFEEVDQNRLQAKEETVTTPEHYNDLGIRKYDLAAFFRRLKNNFRGSSTMNPKLVNYLAAGSIQGLRPMRYEKRVARNRFLFIFLGVLALLVGLFVAIARNYR